MTNILLMGGLGTIECAFILLLVLLCKFYFFSRKGVKDKKNEDSINSQKKSLSNELRVESQTHVLIAKTQIQRR